MGLIDAPLFVGECSFREFPSKQEKPKYGSCKRVRRIHFATENALKRYYSRSVFDIQEQLAHFEQSRVVALSVGGDLLLDYARWMEDHQQKFLKEVPPSAERSSALQYIAGSINEVYLVWHQERATLSLAQPSPEFPEYFS